MLKRLPLCTIYMNESLPSQQKQYFLDATMQVYVGPFLAPVHVFFKALFPNTHWRFSATETTITPKVLYKVFTNYSLQPFTKLLMNECDVVFLALLSDQNIFPGWFPRQSPPENLIHLSYSCLADPFLQQFPHTRNVNFRTVTPLGFYRLSLLVFMLSLVNLSTLVNPDEIV